MTSPDAYEFPFITFYPASILALLLLGTNVGGAVAVCSALIAWYAFLPPANSWRLDELAATALGCYWVAILLTAGCVWSLEQALQRAQAAQDRLSQYLNDQSELVSRVAKDGRLLYANHAFRQFFGIAETDIGTEKWCPLVHPDDIARVQAELAPLSGDQPIIVIENRVVAADNSVRWVRFENRAIIGPDGSVREMHSVGTDVTARRAMEESVTKAHSDVRRLYDEAPCGYHSLDPTGKILRINQTEAAWIGLPAEDLVGRRYADFLTPASNELFARKFPEFLESGRIKDVEIELIGISGRRTQILVAATAERDAAGAIVGSRSTAFDITTQRELERSVRESQQRASVIVDENMVAIAASDPVSGRFVHVNSAFCALTGFPLNAIIGHTAFELGLWLDAQKLTDVRRQVATTDVTSEVQTRLRRRDGSIRWVRTAFRVTEGQQPRLMIGSLVDVSDMVASRQLADESERALRSIFAATPTGLAMIDEHGVVRRNNDAFARALDLPLELVRQRELSIRTVAAYCHARGDYGERSLEEVLTEFDSRVSMPNGVTYERAAGGHYVSVSYSPLGDGRTLISITDSTAVHADLTRVSDAASHDALTGIRNRRGIVDHLTRQIALGSPRQVGAVMMLDLDQFKSLNDSHGHAAGDSLLRQAAERITECLRVKDVVGRLGGDEFLVVLEAGTVDVPTWVRAASAIASKIQRRFNEEFEVEDASAGDSSPIRHLCTCSIGIVTFRLGDGTVDELLAAADHAMYCAKTGGRNRWVAETLNSPSATRESA